ncbi:hypothetical protein F5Y11DRAFT_362239 [Daldinia sp. FL1419]|nr:hypothetical protein F5Y11DRAFT_362239 [Daldinia sp. FL1419]
MVKNKPRLYVVCFIRGSEGGNPDPYHWALASGPKGGGINGMFLYHVRNVQRGGNVEWEFEEPPRNLSVRRPLTMLTLTVVAKIENLERLEKVIRDVPVDNNASWAAFNCQIWVEQALAAIVKDRRCVGTNAIPADWATLHQQCTSFSDPIRQTVVQGQSPPDPIPIQDLMPE